MSTAVAMPSPVLGRLGKIREVLDLIGAVRGIRQPLTTPEGLRQALTLLLKFAELVGIDADWSARLGVILNDDGVFRIVLAIVQYAFGLAGKEQSDSSLHVAVAEGQLDVHLDAQSFAEWLPVVIQIISLIRQIQGSLRGAQ